MFFFVRFEYFSFFMIILVDYKYLWFYILNGNEIAFLYNNVEITYITLIL